MLMRVFWIGMTTFLMASCASTDMRPELERGMVAIPNSRYSDAQTIEEIRRLQPQARIPLKVAVIPIRRWIGISDGELTVINQWGDKLKETGFIKSLEIIPNSLMPSCGYNDKKSCFLNESRAAGARVGADAVLFLSENTVTDSYVNPLSILNLSIVGMWFVPGHHRDSYSAYEASLFDIDNGYLYAFVRGRGEQKSIRPYMYASSNTGQEEARINALTEVGAKLLSLAKEHMDKLSTLGK